jgi:hypothetical protein
VRVNMIQKVGTPIALYSCIFGVDIIVELAYAFSTIFLCILQYRYVCYILSTGFKVLMVLRAW